MSAACVAHSPRAHKHIHCNNRSIENDLVKALERQWTAWKGPLHAGFAMRIGFELVVPMTHHWCNSVDSLFDNASAAAFSEQLDTSAAKPTTMKCMNLLSLENATSSQRSVEMHASLSFSTIGCLHSLMMHRVCKNNGLSKVKIVDIPMQSGKKDTSHDVELFCDGLIVDIARDVKYNRRLVNLRWMKVDRKLNIEQHRMTRSMHRITPVHTNLQPTMGLMKHLANGKPVGLCIEGKEDVRSN